MLLDGGVLYSHKVKHLLERDWHMVLRVHLVVGALSEQQNAGFLLVADVELPLKLGRFNSNLKVSCQNLQIHECDFQFKAEFFCDFLPYCFNLLALLKATWRAEKDKPVAIFMLLEGMSLIFEV